MSCAFRVFAQTRFEWVCEGIDTGWQRCLESLGCRSLFEKEPLIIFTPELRIQCVLHRLGLSVCVEIDMCAMIHPWAVHLGCLCRLVLSVCVKIDTEWQRCLGYLKLQVFFRNRATNYRTLLRKMTSKDKVSYGSSPPCMCAMIHPWAVHLGCLRGFGFSVCMEIWHVCYDSLLSWALSVFVQNRFECACGDWYVCCAACLWCMCDVTRLMRRTLHIWVRREVWRFTCVPWIHTEYVWRDVTYSTHRAHLSKMNCVEIYMCVMTHAYSVCVTWRDTCMEARRAYAHDELCV